MTEQQQRTEAARPQHTPGPWRQRDVHPDAWTRQVWTDEGHGSVMIAEAGGVNKDANAALIAAAPELAAALQRLVRGEGEVDRFELNQALAALAKAGYTA